MWRMWEGLVHLAITDRFIPLLGIVDECTAFRIARVVDIEHLEKKHLSTSQFHAKDCVLAAGVNVYKW